MKMLSWLGVTCQKCSPSMIRPQHPKIGIYFFATMFVCCAVFVITFYLAAYKVCEFVVAYDEQRKSAPQSVTVNIEPKQDRVETILWGNNPGNVKGVNWDGQIGTDKRGFAIFKHHVYGLRAMAITLLEYQRKHDIHTIDGLVKRYSRTDHNEYTSFLCSRLKVSKNDRISVASHLPELIKAMITFEYGQQPYPEEDFVLLSVYKNK